MQAAFDELDDLRRPLRLRDQDGARPLIRRVGVVVAGEGIDRVDSLQHVGSPAVSYTHIRSHETVLDIVRRLLLENNNTHTQHTAHTD